MNLIKDTEAIIDQVAQLYGSDYVITFIARHRKSNSEHNRDIILTRDKLPEVINGLERMKSEQQKMMAGHPLATAPRKSKI